MKTSNMHITKKVGMHTIFKLNIINLFMVVYVVCICPVCCMSCMYVCMNVCMSCMHVLILSPSCDQSFSGILATQENIYYT